MDDETEEEVARIDRDYWTEKYEESEEDSE